MRIGIIGAGHIGGNIARQAVRVGHDVILSHSRRPETLERLAAELGPHAVHATVREAVENANIVILSVPWKVVDAALEAAGPLNGRVVVDTTNYFGIGLGPAQGQTAAAFNAGRMPHARYVKCFNTLTAAFQAEAALRSGDGRVVQWLCGEDAGAVQLVETFVDSLGYVPVDLGGVNDCAVMESPRRPGSVYGEEYRSAEALLVVQAVRSGRPIPPIPVYQP